MIICQNCNQAGTFEHFDANGSCYLALNIDDKAEFVAISQITSASFVPRDVDKVLIPTFGLSQNEILFLADNWGDQSFSFSEKLDLGIIKILMSLLDENPTVANLRVSQLTNARALDPFNEVLAREILELRSQRHIEGFNYSDLVDGIAFLEGLNFANPLGDLREILNSVWLNDFSFFSEFIEYVGIIYDYVSAFKIPLIADLAQIDKDLYDQLMILSPLICQEPSKGGTLLNALTLPNDEIWRDVNWVDVVQGIKMIGDLVIPRQRPGESPQVKLVRLLLWEKAEYVLSVLENADQVSRILRLNPKLRENPNNPAYLKPITPHVSQSAIPVKRPNDWKLKPRKRR